MHESHPDETHLPAAPGAEEAPSPAAAVTGTEGMEPAPGRLRLFWREWVRPLILVLLVLGSIRSAVADWNDVPTGSMKPTIVEGDRIFVNKAAYDLRFPFTRFRLMEWGEPQSGDIVVLFSPEDGKRLVKRVIGVPGDRLEVRHGRLMINGEPVNYGPIDPGVSAAIAPGERRTYRILTEEIGDDGHPVMLAPWADATSFFGPVEVPAGNFFVMGDNRSNSKDSRSFGFVERRDIVGRATAVVLSLDRERRLVPRWNRFFQRLQ